ncbi:MAG TPA: hypothetical protein VEP90_01575 [Methylomirabilota bacterium]|nr:hypothetical protein [Methylomirabilota bacterium]
MTREDLEQIGSLIDQRVKPLQDGQARLEARIAEVKLEQGELRQGQAQIKTAVEAVHAGQDDMREKIDKLPTEAAMMDLGAKMDKVTRNHERRITNLEEHTGASNPTKN